MASKNLKKLRKDFGYALTLIDDYEGKLKDWKKDVSLDNKNIEIVNVEQSSYLAYYDEIKVHLKTMLDYFDYLLKSQKATDMQALISSSKRSLTDRMAEKLAEDSQDYRDLFMIYLEVKELYLTAHSVVEQFQQRAFAINNIIKIREKELQGITLHLHNE